MKAGTYELSNFKGESPISPLNWSLSMSFAFSTAMNCAFSMHEYESFVKQTLSFATGPSICPEPKNCFSVLSDAWKDFDYDVSNLSMLFGQPVHFSVTMYMRGDPVSKRTFIF